MSFRWLYAEFQQKENFDFYNNFIKYLSGGVDVMPGRC
jgi:hypothetical protein